MKVNGVDRIAEKRAASKEDKDSKYFKARLHNKRRPKHTGRTYQCWINMIRRCTDPTDKVYKNYGGRGITVCERWLVYENFYKDMGPKPVDLEIDRIDNNKGYFKENCRWTTHTNNMRNTRKGDFMNVIPTLTDEQAEYILQSRLQDLKENNTSVDFS